MRLDVGHIEFSKHDLKRKIRVPTKLSPMLAEDFGFHLGDGCMINYRRKDSGTIRYQFVYTGNSKKDLDYFQKCLMPRKKKLFNIGAKIKEHSSENSIRVSFYSKALYEFFTACGVPPGKKSNIPIPEMIKNTNLTIKTAFLRGLAAADFCVCVKNRRSKLYPTIKFVTISPSLCSDVCNILDELAIPFSRYEEVQMDKRGWNSKPRHSIDINGRERLSLWLKKIGFSDKRNLTSAMKFTGPSRFELETFA